MTSPYCLCNFLFLLLYWFHNCVFFSSLSVLCQSFLVISICCFTVYWLSLRIFIVFWQLFWNYIVVLPAVLNFCYWIFVNDLSFFIYLSIPYNWRHLLSIIVINFVGVELRDILILKLILFLCLLCVQKGYLMFSIADKVVRKRSCCSFSKYCKKPIGKSSKSSLPIRNYLHLRSFLLFYTEIFQKCLNPFDL